MTALVRYEQARTALAECHRVDEVKDIRDMFVRCLKVFEPSNARLSRVQIREGSPELEDVRKQVATWMGAAPKKKAAPVIRAAKSVQADYLTAA